MFVMYFINCIKSMAKITYMTYINYMNFTTLRLSWLLTDFHNFKTNIIFKNGIISMTYRKWMIYITCMAWITCMTFFGCIAYNLRNVSVSDLVSDWVTQFLLEMLSHLKIRWTRLVSLVMLRFQGEWSFFAGLYKTVYPDRM